jgi:hypothetical protein
MPRVNVALRAAHEGGWLPEFDLLGRSSDLVNTYQLWVRHELFCGKLTDAAFQASETNLVEFIKARGNTKPHLTDLVS